MKIFHQTPIADCVLNFSHCRGIGGHQIRYEEGQHRLENEAESEIQGDDVVKVVDQHQYGGDNTGNLEGPVHRTSHAREM